jgi:D-alanyl-D-alanine carboxypeptidase
MAAQRVGALSARAAYARVVLAVLVVMLGLTAPQAVAVSAHAAPPIAGAAVDGTRLTSLLQADLEAYLQERGAAEHASAAGLSVSLVGREASIDVSAGTTTFGGSHPVGPDALWQIGSNTKAFTSVVLLQLEAEHALSIDDPLGRWLPEYPQWGTVSIRRLLNMTSGIATYDEQPAFRTDYLADPRRYFAPEQLVDYAVGTPATSGYSYSNTNYVLAEMIIERVTGHSYQYELRNRLLEPLHLCDVYYRAHLYPTSVSLSWGRGAGGIIAALGDMTRWERALYSAALLPAQQQAELTSLVSSQTGQPIEQTSLEDPTGFGLGVAQLTAPGLGTAWYYEGGTVGFRMLHIYVPESGLILAMALNSATDDDRIELLLQSVYGTLLEQGVVPAPAPAAVAG